MVEHPRMREKFGETSVRRICLTPYFPRKDRETRNRMKFKTISPLSHCLTARG